MGESELKAHVRVSAVPSAPTDSGLLMHVYRINALEKKMREGAEREKIKEVQGLYKRQAGMFRALL